MTSVNSAMQRVQVLMLTDRGQTHQRLALKAAPAEIELTILRRPEAAPLHAALAEAEVIISERNQAITAEMIAAAPELRFILRLGSLIHDIDLDAARRLDVRVSAQPVLDSILAAEHVLMMSLAVLKRLGRSMSVTVEPRPPAAARRTDENVFSFNWMGYKDIQSLFGKTVAILGMGEIGIEFVRRLEPFHPVAILYNKRNRFPAAVEQMFGIEYTGFDTCVREADVLVSLLPFTRETAHLLGTGVFEMMPSYSVLVHAGSGGVINEAELVETLRRGHIAGAAVDTFEMEPLFPERPIVQFAREGQANVLLTPHTASASLPVTRAEDFAEILRFLHGEPLCFEIGL